MTNAQSWYKTQKKPKWAPPSWLFGPVWTVLYVLIAVSFGTVFMKVASGELPPIVALPFALNLFFNVIFSPIQFRLRSNVLAAVDVLLVLLTLLWALFTIYVFSLTQHISTGASDLPWIIYANIPYLLWVSFATVLQLTVTYLNRRGA
jgi:tryptophan-rich sensory protein